MAAELYSLGDLTASQITAVYVSQGFMIAITAVIILATTCLVISFLINPQFHVNMILLIINLAILCIVYSISEIITAIRLLDCPLNEYCFTGHYMVFVHQNTADLIKIASAICNVIALPLVICERIVATVYFRSYEKKQHLYLVVVIILIQWMVSFFIVYLMIMGYLPVLAVAILGSAFCLIFILLFFYIDHINHKMYHESMAEGSAYTLSQRYQLCENIRTSSLLRRCSILSSICIPITITFFTLHVLFINLKYKILFKVCFEISAACFGLLFIAFAIKTNKLWCRNFFRLFCCLYRRRSSSRITPYLHQTRDNVYTAKIFRTSTGEPMLFHTNLESTLYFSQLQSSWNK